MAGTAGCESPPRHAGPWRAVVLEPDDPSPPADYREGLIEGLGHGASADAGQLTLRTSRGPARSLPAQATTEQAAGADLALTVTTAALAAGAQAAPAVIFTDVADPAAAGVREPGFLARWLPSLFGTKGVAIAGAYAVTDFGRLLEITASVMPMPGLGAVFAAADADSVAYRDQLRAFASRTVLSQPLDPAHPDAAVRALCEQKVGALVLLGDRSTDAVLAELIAAARTWRMVVLGTRAPHAAAGAVITLARDERAAGIAAGRRAAAFMRGERPQLEPFERITQQRLILNAQTAEQAGVGLPLAIIERADEVLGD
jgi:putative ABC transport system substrate-binding protein